MTYSAHQLKILHPTHREQTVRQAAVNLYALHSEIYLNYRSRDGAREEDAAWNAVDDFVRRRGLTEASILDLGCGSGAACMLAWSPRRYIGFDLSPALLDRHILRDSPNATLRQVDLGRTVPQLRDSSDADLILSVLALHYLPHPGVVLDALAKPGRTFCFLVANAEHDGAHVLSDNLVHLGRGKFELVYFPHALSDYVGWLGPIAELGVWTCGGQDGENHPYLLIGGRW